MSDRITTAAERQALPAGTVVLSSGGTIACRHVDLDGVLFGMDMSFPWDRLQLPLTVLYRPDAPERTDPTAVSPGQKPAPAGSAERGGHRRTAANARRSLIRSRALNLLQKAHPVEFQMLTETVAAELEAEHA